MLIYNFSKLNSFKEARTKKPDKKAGRLKSNNILEDSIEELKAEHLESEQENKHA